MELRQVKFTFLENKIPQILIMSVCSGVGRAESPTLEPAPTLRVVFQKSLFLRKLARVQPSWSVWPHQWTRNYLLLLQPLFHLQGGRCVSPNFSIFRVSYQMNFRKSVSRVYRELRFHFQRLSLQVTNFWSSRNVQRAF